MFAKRLKQARLTKKMTLEEVARTYNELFCASMTGATLSRYENQKQEPTVSVVAGLCRVLGVSADFLLDTGNERICRVPVLEDADSYGENEKDLVASIAGWEEVLVEGEDAKKMIAIKMPSDAMAPRIRRGDILLAKKDQDVGNGDLVLLALKGGSVFCRRVYLAKEGVIFAADNANTPPIFFSPEEVQQGAFSIVGKVEEIRSRV